MKRIRHLIQAGALSVCLLLWSCGGEPYTYVPDHELKPGPGLFSGEDGEFTLIGTSSSEEDDSSAENSDRSSSVPE